MNRLAYIVIVSVFVVLFQVAFFYGTYHEQMAKDTVSVSECLMRTHDKDALRDCFGVFVDSKDYDLYLRRYDEILYKTEAY